MGSGGGGGALGVGTRLGSIPRLWEVGGGGGGGGSCI